MALNNHVKWHKHNLRRHPSCFLCKRKEGGQCRGVKICEESPPSAQNYKEVPKCGAQKWFPQDCLLSLFLLSLSLDVRRVEGPGISPRPGSRGGRRRLGVSVFGKAFQLIVYPGPTARPQAAMPGAPDASSRDHTQALGQPQ